MRFGQFLGTFSTNGKCQQEEEEEEEEQEQEQEQLLPLYDLGFAAGKTRADWLFGTLVLVG